MVSRFGRSLRFGLRTAPGDHRFMQSEDEIGRVVAVLRSAEVRIPGLDAEVVASLRGAVDALYWVVGHDDGSFAGNLAKIEAHLKNLGFEVKRKNVN